MEHYSNATSNCSRVGEIHGLDGPGFGAFSLLMALLSVAQCSLTILTIAALCMARTMSKHLRIFLINILVGVLVLGGGGLLLTMPSVILVFAKTQLRSTLFCRLLAWVLSVGGYSRPLNLSLYSVVVLVTVRLGKKDWKMLHSGFSIALVWLMALILSTISLVPQVSSFQIIEQVVCCFQKGTGITVALPVYLTTNIIFGNLIPLAVSIVTPVYCLCYIRRHSISGDTVYKKAISRLSLFLVAGSAVNVAGNVVITVCAFASYTSVSVYLLYGVGVLSLLPTPIFITMFLKVVRDQMKAIITCHRNHHRILPLSEVVAKH